MPDQTTSSGTGDVISFGPFTMYPDRRLLERDGAEVRLGARSLDLLLALIEQASEVVGKNDLLARVWPGVTIDEAGLRVHIASLRKALGDGEGNARYLSTVTGKGYCFVAPIARAGLPLPLAAPIPPSRAINLPPRLRRAVGIEQMVPEIALKLRRDRFVSVTGPGGIGKTTTAISVGHEMLAEFDGKVHFFDLGPVDDPALVPGAIASTLGLLVQTADPTPGIIAHFGNQRTLLILDSCEHVIEAVAALIDRIYGSTPDVHILATSRESLRVQGEYVYRLPPLDCPPEDTLLTAASALAYPAVQLFVERAAAAGRQFELDDANAPTVAEICRRLDGIALAIELAAGRTDAPNLQKTIALLSDRIALLWRGRRTAPPRHQTLNATLNWSYDLLSDDERMVLARLSVFAGPFTLDAARAVVADQTIGETGAITVIADLVAKSLVAVNAGGAACRYRLLDTTRAYALGKLVERGEANLIRRRHAGHYCELLQLGEAARPAAPDDARSRSEHHANVRAALQWSFSTEGDAISAVALAAASAPMFLAASLLTECHRWTEQAIRLLDDANRSTPLELELQAALGLSLMFTRGNSDEARSALLRALGIAEQLGDLHSQLRLLGRLHIFDERIGHFRSATAFAERAGQVAAATGDPVAIAEAHSALGISYHLDGDRARAHSHLQAALSEHSESRRISAFHFGFDFRNRANIALARTLWIEGYPDRAAAVAAQTVREAEPLDHPVTLCIALIWAVSVSIWSGDFADADRYIDRFIAEADRHSLTPYQAAGRGVIGELKVRRGETQEGLHLLREALARLHAARYELLTTAFNSALAEGFAIAGRHQEALAQSCEAIATVERNGDYVMLPELLRIKACSLAALAQPDAAEQHLLQSLDLAARQSALSWQLRTATSLAELRLAQDRRDAAYGTLAPIFARFTEGFRTADLKKAAELLARLG